MILTKENIIKKVERQKYKNAVIYEGHQKEMDRLTFEKFSAESPEALINDLNEFFKSYNGTFMMLLSTSSSVQRSNCDQCFFKTEPTTQSEQGKKHGYSFEDLDRLKKDLREELKTEFEEREKREKEKEEKEALQSELKELKTNGGKLANVIYQFLVTANEGKKLKMQLQGSNQRQRKQEIDQEEINELESALGRLVELFGEQDIIDLAYVLDDNDPIIPNVKMYIQQKISQGNGKKENKKETGNHSQGRKRFY